jgi:uncharacterized membrane protein YeaQ/YmgE (transglycosylase-associated protein family)
MKLGYAVGALVLAANDVSPWQVLWWLLCAVVVVVGAVLAVRHFRLWWQGLEQRRWPTSVVSVVGAGCSLLVWGMLAGWATLP